MWWPEARRARTDPRPNVEPVGLVGSRRKLCRGLRANTPPAHYRPQPPPAPPDGVGTAPSPTSQGPFCWMLLASHPGVGIGKARSLVRMRSKEVKRQCEQDYEEDERCV